MEFARLPDDAPLDLVQDTIVLEDLRLAWPQVLASKRRVPEDLVKTQVCRRKQKSGQPVRRFTSLSARAFAIELATQDNPEKYLCPHLCSGKLFNGDQARQSGKYSSPTANNISQPEPTPSPNSTIEVPPSPGRPEINHEGTRNLGNAADEEVGCCAKPAKSKDPKSLAQALLDTKAIRRLYAPSDHRSNPWTSFHRSGPIHSYDRSQLQTAAESAARKECCGIKIKGVSEQLRQQQAEQRTSIRRFIHRHESGIDEQPRPQTLSHFSVKNVKALVWATRVSRNTLAKEQYTKESFGWTLAHNTAVDTSANTSTVPSSIIPFARQSIVYVLSNLQVLSLSFRHIDDQGGYMPDSFNRVVQSLYWLRILEGYSPIILPSLLQAADTLYASLLCGKDCSALHASLNNEPPETFSRVISDIEAAHISNTFFAALVASIPPCSEQVWWLVYDCHQKGVMIQDQVKDPAVIHSFQSVMDAFENSTALDLLAKLVKILSTHMSVTAMTNKAALKEDAPQPYPTHQSHIFECVMHYWRLSEPRPFAYSPAVGGLRWKYDLLPPGGQRLGTPLYSAMIVEWLKVLVIRTWDGKPDIELSSTTGCALEVLRRLHDQINRSGGSAIIFQMPLLVAQLDSLHMRTEWPDTVYPPNHKHLLQYPFIFDLKSKVCCFRAMNYAKMSKANEEAAVASRLLAKVAFSDTLTGRGEIRLQEKLHNVLKNRFVIEIRRQNVLDDAFDQLWRREERELMRPLKVRMGMDEGEEGVDHGGVQQEFFRIAIVEALNPDHGKYKPLRLSLRLVKRCQADNILGLFSVIDEQTQMTWFQPCSQEALYNYELVGLLFSLAMYNGLPLPVNLPLAFYRKLQGSKIIYPNQIEDGWPALAKGLQSLLDWSDGDVGDVFARTYDFSFETLGERFTIDIQRYGSLGDYYAQHGHLASQTPVYHAGQDHDLPSFPSVRGNEDDRKAFRDATAEKEAKTESSHPSAPMVTNKNRVQYVQDYIYWLTDRSIEGGFKAFADGFFTCISPQALTLFSAREFKRLLEGTQNVTVEDLRRISHYDGGYTAAHKTIQDFWRTVEDFSPIQIASFLEFVTASDRLPITGSDNMSILIQKNGEGDDRLPTSSTCYSRLLLPAYSSRAVLKEKLCLAIENSKGFGVP
ncbi:MAG: hypothetical protein Q9213_004947 [Squamulea squamosa]